MLQVFTVYILLMPVNETDDKQQTDTTTPSNTNHHTNISTSGNSGGFSRRNSRNKRREGMMRARDRRVSNLVSVSFFSSFIIKYQFTLTSYIYGTKTQRGRDRRQTANGHDHLQYLGEWKTRFTTMPRHVKMAVAAAATGVRVARDKRVLETVMRLASRASYRYVLCLYILFLLNVYLMQLATYTESKRHEASTCLNSSGSSNSESKDSNLRR